MARNGALLTGFATLVVTIATIAAAKVFEDPAPPQVAALSPAPPAEAKENPDATFHAPPKPLHPQAVTQDWPQFLGPDHNNVSRETHLAARFDAKGPPIVWEVAKGSGYSAPAIVGERLILFHRVEDEEVVDCLHPQTGKRYWRHAYPSSYQDRYGYSDGPRGSPAIAPHLDAVFTYGAQGKLLCLELSTGRVKWSRQLLKEFGLRQNFFGVGSSPLVEGDLVIINIGVEPGGPCVAAFDGASGKMVWGAGEKWGPGYATPVPATMHGKRRIFVFAGGESDPPTGGLLSIDPATGAVHFSFPWRGNRRESVNASSPLVLGEQVFISESYGAGGAMLEITEDGEVTELWDNPSFGTHFMSAVQKDEYLYGVDGHGPHDAFLVCVDMKSGEDVWRTQPEWQEETTTRTGQPRKMTLGTYRCWLTPVEGGKRFLCLGEFGHLLWVDLSPKGYKELSRAWLFAASDTWTPPVISRGLLYVCQNNPASPAGEPGPRLICYDLRAEMMPAPAQPE